MIRPTLPAETDRLVEMARETRVFKPIEIDALREVLHDFHKGNIHLGHHAVSYELHGAPIGFAYYAPTPMTEGTWHLYWIFVDKQTQAKGIGAKLLRHVEEHIALAGGRMLVIETSSMPHYELTRKFYLKHKYDQDAVIHDFYGAGDDMVVFRKKLKEN
jgi:GNAT superfamily N-acetyltransferase